jgi:hypothetical protein
MSSARPKAPSSTKKRLGGEKRADVRLLGKGRKYRRILQRSLEVQGVTDLYRGRDVRRSTELIRQTTAADPTQLADDDVDLRRLVGAGLT